MKSRGVKAQRTEQQRKNGTTIVNRNFSVLEDDPQSFELIKEMTVRAGKNAAAEARVAGLPYTFANSKEVIRLYADGKKEVIATVSHKRMKSDSFYISYTPSTVFHARKK